MDAVSPCRAETVPRMRTVEGVLEVGDAEWKAWRWAGRRRGVGSDILLAIVWFAWLGGFVGSWRRRGERFLLRWLWVDVACDRER